MACPHDHRVISSANVSRADGKLTCECGEPIAIPEHLNAMGRIARADKFLDKLVLQRAVQDADRMRMKGTKPH